MKTERSFLELRVIWKDDDMFEINVAASNGVFSGSIQVYDTSAALSSFAKSLLYYPVDSSPLFYEAGQRGGYAYFSLKFYCIDNAGHIGVLINLEGNVPTEYRVEEKSIATFELRVEPNAIDVFQKELLQLAIGQEGLATLIG